MSKLTKEQLKKNVEKVKVAEVLSAIDIQYVKGAVNVKDEDLVEMAFLSQHEHEIAGSKFANLLKGMRVEVFFDQSNCPFPLGDVIEAIFLDDMIICKKQ